MAIKGGRPNNRRIAAHLFVRDAARAVEFYRRALGAEELYRSPMPDGKGIHAQLKIADSVLLVTEESMAHPEWTLRSPQTLGGTSAVLELYVDDVDAAFARAVDAGARPTMPVMDTFFGDRYGQLADPFGHVWALATVKEELSPDQVEARMREHYA